MPDVWSTPNEETPWKRDSSWAAVSNTGWIARHNVFQEAPSWRDNPSIDACSPRSCPMAHLIALVVSSRPGRAMAWSCSTKEPTARIGSGQIQRCLRHRSLTGRPKLGASTSSATVRPWPWDTTPHTGHPITVGADSMVANTLPTGSCSTPTTWNPSRPTSRSQRSH